LYKTVKQEMELLRFYVKELQKLFKSI